MTHAATILIIGPSGAGKSTASELLRELGWHVVSASRVLRELALARELTLRSRAELQEFGKHMVEVEPSVFATHLLAEVPSYKLHAIEGLRGRRFINYVRNLCTGTAVVYIDTKPSVRKSRVMLRDGIAERTFVDDNAQVLELELLHMGAEADIVLENDGSLADLRAKIGLLFKSG